MRALRERPRGWFPHDDPDAFLVAAVRAAVTLFGGRDAIATPYGDGVRGRRASIRSRRSNCTSGTRRAFPGSGGSYAPAVQALVLGQSFRAVWDVGAWDAGGIDLPLGESGEPGSPHYTDRRRGAGCATT